MSAHTLPKWVHPTVLGAAIATGLGLWTYVGMRASGALFLAFNKNDPRRAEAASIVRYWSRHGDDQTQRRKLVCSMALGFGVPSAAILGLWAAMKAKPSPHGDARWATPAEVMRSGLCESENNTGIIVGRYKGQYLTAPHDMHTVAVAPSGSGKTKALAIPALLNCPYSALVQDNKREIFTATSGWRKRCGHKVYRFSPYDEKGRTHGTNPLAYIPDDPVLRISVLMETANTIYPHDSGATNSGGNFFSGSSRDLFLGMALYVLESPEMPRTMGQMLRVARGDGRPIKEYLAALVVDREKVGRPLSYDCVAAIQSLITAADDTLGDIVRTFLNDMACFADPLVDAATSRHDFDWRRMRREPMTVYVEIPFNKTAAARVLTTLLFSQAIACQLDAEWGASPDLKHEMLWMADEVAALGRLPILPAGASYVRSYGIHLFILFQALSQLEGEYGHHVARTITANMRCRVLFAPALQEDADDQSKMLGTFTLRTANRSRTSGTNNSSTGTTDHDYARALMLAQELRQMPFEHEILDVVGQRPVFCHKAFYSDDPELVARVLPPAPVPEHNPRLHFADVRRMVREAGPDESLGDELQVDQVDADLEGLPPLRADCSPEEAQGYVSEVFARLAAADAAAAQACSVVNSIEGKPPTKPECKAKPATGNKGRKRPAAAQEPDDLFPDLEFDVESGTAAPPQGRHPDDLDLST